MISMSWNHFFWALAFSVAMLLARISESSALMSLADGLAVLILSASFACVLSLALSRVPALLAALLLGLVTAFYLAAFRYEAIFGVLPGPEVFFYANELSLLLPSIVSELDLKLGLLFVIVCPGLIAAGRVCWSSHGTRSDYASLLLVVLIAVSGTHSLLTPSVSRSSEPVVWLVKQAVSTDRGTPEVADLGKTDFANFLSFHGIPNADITEGRFPLCREVETESQPTGQSVIILVLENVGHEEMQFLPNLTRFAEDNLWMRDFMSVGTKSVQAMPAYFGGLPPNPHANYLWQRPLPNMPSIARLLSEEGYTTSYFHGGDLSFEQQRHYLNQAGFEQIFEFGDYDHPVYGWGYDDAAMFSELTKWIEQQEEPYLAALATISTHHPFILPETFTPSVTELPVGYQDSLAQRQTYEFLDETLKHFFTWFESQDALLLVVGDHAPDRGDQKHQFRVPLIVAGLESMPDNLTSAFSEGKGIGYDLPNTVLNAIGLSDLPCSPGLPLVASRNTETRQRYTVAGHNLEAIYFHGVSETLVFNKATLQFHEARPGGGLGELIPMSEVPSDTIDWFQSVMRVHFSLLENNSYAPENSDLRDLAKEAPDTVDSIFVSHRGNTEGEDRLRENTRTAIEAAITSGMDWIEVDIQTDRLGEPFLFHDPAVNIDGRTVQLNELTLTEIKALPGMEAVLSLEEALGEYAAEVNFAIEVKPLQHVAMLIRLAQRVTDLINTRPGDNQVIVDSFDSTLLRSIQRNCECEVGIDHPYRQPVTENDLVHYAMLGYDWIYLEQSVIDETVLNQAHDAGIKVMGYTINSLDTLSPAVRLRLDGVITDRSALKSEWLQSP